MALKEIFLKKWEPEFHNVLLNDILQAWILSSCKTFSVFVLYFGYHGMWSVKVSKTCKLVIVAALMWSVKISKTCKLVIVAALMKDMELFRDWINQSNCGYITYTQDNCWEWSSSQTLTFYGWEFHQDSWTCEVITGRDFFCSLVRTNSLDNVYLCFTTIRLKCVFRKLKLVSAVFYQIFIFSPNDSLSKTIKNVFYLIWKAFFVLRTFKFLYFFLFLSTLSRLKRTNGTGIIYHELAYIH